MGEKPLYYYDGPGVFVFGSELRALVEHPDVPRALDLQSLSRYLLVDAVPAPHSILAGAAKLAPAHTLVVSPGAKPLVTASFLPKYALARAARGSVKVALSGDGGDEIFCGYPTFLADAAARWLLATLPPTARRVVGRLIDGLPASPKYASVDFLLKQFMRALPYPAPVRTQLLLGGITAAEQSGLLSPGVRHALEGFDPYAELTTAIEQLELRDPIERLIHHHARFYLADQTLVAMDRASMAAGLEVRAPFLDPALVELAATIPSELKLNGWTTKYILKSALEGILPPTVIRRRKQGLGVPIAAWLRGPLRGGVESRLAPARVRRRGLFAPTTVARLVSDHVDGRRDHRKILWALLMLDAWCDHYLPHERWT